MKTCRYFVYPLWGHVASKFCRKEGWGDLRGLRGRSPTLRIEAYLARFGGFWAPMGDVIQGALIGGAYDFWRPGFGFDRLSAPP